jgi:hypothetical protein
MGFAARKFINQNSGSFPSHWVGGEMGFEIELDDSFVSIVNGGGMIVAITARGLVARTTDGINWLSSSLPAGQWSDITYGNGRFVAVGALGSDGISAYSSNAANWTNASMPTGLWLGVTYGAGKFVAVGHHSKRSAYSSNGINWTISNNGPDNPTFPADDLWHSVSFGNNIFVAITGISISRSSDGINWTYSPFDSTNPDIYYDIKFSGGIFVIAGETGRFGGGNGKVTYGSDGVNWFEKIIENQDNGYRNFYTSIATKGDDFVIITKTINIQSTWATKINAQKLYTDQFIAIPEPLNVRAESENLICYGENLSGYSGKDRFVCIYGNTNLFIYSKSGPTPWSTNALTDTFSSGKLLYGSQTNFGVNSFFSMNRSNSNQSKKIAVSQDGITWTQFGFDNWETTTYRDFCFSESNTMALVGNQLSDGVIRIYRTPPTGQTLPYFDITTPGYQLRAITFANGKYYIAAFTTTSWYIIEYTVGSTFNAYQIPLTGITDLRYLNGVFFIEASSAFQPGRQVYACNNIISGPYVEIPANYNSSIAYGNNLFVSSIYLGGYTYSSNGIDWTPGGQFQNVYNKPIIAFGNGRFVSLASSVVGNSSRYISAYSNDGIEWFTDPIYQMPYPETIAYGNGRFVALQSSFAGNRVSIRE